MKSKIISMLLLLSLHTIAAQKFYFPKKEVADAALLEKRVSSIAAVISKNYANAKTYDSLDKQFKLEIVSGHFEKSLPLIRKSRQVYADEKTVSIKSIDYEIFAMSKNMERNEKMNFTIALNKAFEQKYATLPEKYSFRLNDVFEYDIKDKKSKLKRSFGNIKNDSLTYNDALQMCLNYLDYQCSSQTQSDINKLLSEKDKKRYWQKSFTIKTSTGGNLVITVTRPKEKKQPLPVILTNSIYAGSYDSSLGKRAVAYHYIGAVVNTRGKRTSNDAIEPFEHEAQDLYDVIDWVSKQPWCNGKVGMIGGSYLGFSQWAATKKLHPALKTIVPQVSVGIGIDFPMENNVFSNYMLQWISYVTNNKMTDEASFKNYQKWDSINTAWYKSGKSFRALDTIAGKPSPIFQRWLQHPSYDDFWKKMIPYKEEFAAIPIPILSTTGFYDSDQLGALYYFKEYHKYHPNPNHYLVMGPYDHGGAQSYPVNVLMGYHLNEAAKINFSDLAYSWFDYILKNGAKPLLLKDKVNIQVMDSDQWYHFPTLEKSHHDQLRFYLTKKADSVLALSQRKPSQSEYVKQMVDFSDREDKNSYYTLKKDSINTTNSVVYTTEVLDKDLIINGAFSAKLKAMINKKDMDITITLMQVKPEGGFFFLSNYLGRASYIKNREERQLLKPNEIEEISITNSTFVGKKIPKGSQLIVLLGVNKNPNTQINYGTGKDVSDETIQDAKEPLEVKWYNDSYIEIPVI
ncbi:CocE/NonD family hydrolase [Chryseobacterium sp. MYb264]|uniref:CocE/NonD family hydrolase n=1 Tax=Chryseobacterium sp. MYb264 TaxID=2745153 RepID=UPI002E11B689|nr:CocE/NonD family hydrolase [Chryseobacterium sp. MYb264]